MYFTTERDIQESVHIKHGRKIYLRIGLSGFTTTAFRLTRLIPGKLWGGGAWSGN